MKRLLIGSCIVGLLMATSPVMAEHGHGLPPGIQKQLERGKALPPGLQKQFLSARYRDHYDYRDHRGDRHWDKHKHKHKHRKHHHKKHGYRDRYKYRDHRDYRDRYRSGYHHTYRGYDDHLPTEHRVARIIRDTQVLIEASRR